MRSSNPSMVAARRKPDLISRDFFSVAGRNRDTDALVWLHLWSGIATVTAPVLDIDSGESGARDFIGDGSIISVDPITYVCEQTITDRTIGITLSRIREAVNDFVRTDDLHEQEAYIYQGDFDTATNTLVAPAECVWAGFVDTAPITDGAVGDQGSIVINIRSHTTELTRTNSLKRSHASEILRDPDDTFYQDTATVGDWMTYLGQPTPTQIKSA